METIKIEILNPKAKSILKGLADLNLINIKREQKKSNFTQLLEKLRKQSDSAPDLNEIAKEVESVRKKRYEN
jgi:trehalose-6-phosphate synthase